MFRIFFGYELLFSAHISFGKGKYLNQTDFFYKTCQAPNLNLTLAVLPIEFIHINLATCDLYLWRYLDFFVNTKDPRMTYK